MTPLNKKKQGVSYSIELIMIFIVVTILAIFILYTAGKNFGFFHKTTNSKAVSIKITSCKAKALYKGGNFRDYDKDGLPDSCDPCPHTPSFGEEFKDIVKDEDEDGFSVPIDRKKQKTWEELNKESLDKTGKQYTGISLCCGNDGTGKDNEKLTENPKKYCETEENDKIAYEPKKLVEYYINPKK